MSGTKQSGSDASSARKKYDELLQLRKTIQESDQNQDSFARLQPAQLLRNEASQLRRSLAADSTNPSVADVTELYNFASEIVQALARERRGPQSGKAASDIATSSGFANRSAIYASGGSGFSPFRQDFVNGSEAAAHENLQSRLVSGFKEAMDKLSADLVNRMDKMEVTVTSRIDRLEERVAKTEAVQSAGQARTDEAIRHLQHGIDRVEISLNRRMDTMEERQSRKIEDLAQRQQQQQPTSAALPHVVHVNFGGNVPRLEGIVSVPGGVSPQSSTRSPIPPPIQETQTAPRLTSFESTSSPFAPPPPFLKNQDIFTVNVPKNTSTLEQLVASKPASVIPQASGSNTISWGNPVVKPAAAAEIPGSQRSFGESSKQPGDQKPSLFSGVSSGFAPPAFDQTAKPNPFASLFPAQSGVKSFQELAAETGAGASPFRKDPQGFAGANTPLFGGNKSTPTVVKGDGDEGGEEGDAAEYEPADTFKPIVDLKDMPEVKVKTDKDEGWEDMFRDRAKLFRRDRVTQEWKERGLGDMTIQKRVDPSDGRTKCRVLMRWEKTHKICANHMISPDIKLERPTSDTKTHWRWLANDFADGELKMELLLVKFKKAEQADAFKTALEQAKKDVAAAPASTPSSAPKPSGAPVASLSEMFKPKAGAWSCNDCYTSNNADVNKCAACGGLKPGTMSAEDTSSKPFTNLFQPSSTVQSSSGFSFGPTANFNFAPPPVAAASATAPSQSGGFTFAGFSAGIPPAAAPKPGGFSFQPPSVAPSQPANPPLFPSTFNFNMPPVNKPEEEEPDQDDTVDPEERSDVYFEPLVTLPEVEVKTGEEDEIELYSQRAKLFRYTENEWKERGIGDLKMLKARDANRVRLLMRRETVLKVCCNHAIREEMKLEPFKNAKNAWVWSAMDFTEGELQRETFAVRFKFPEHAAEFAELFERCQRIVSGKEEAPVDGFSRVEVDDNQSILPLVDTGKKSESPATKTIVRDVKKQEVDNDELTPAEIEQARQNNIWGDKIYRNFGAVYNAKKAAVAVVAPELGIYALRNSEDLKAMADADKISKEAVHTVIQDIAHKINIDEPEEIPEAVRRYLVQMRIKEQGDDEAWRIPVFEGQVVLQRQKDGTNRWEDLGRGRLRICREEEVYGPLYLEFNAPSDNPLAEPKTLAIHVLNAELNLKKDLRSNQAEWGIAEDEVNSRSERATFKADFQSTQSLKDFEKQFVDAVRFAQEMPTSY